MPELPEVQTVVSELNKKLTGRKIARVEVHLGKIISIGPHTVSNIRDGKQSKVNQFVKLLTGQKIVSVKRRGKMIIIDLSGPLALLVHLKMTGQFIFEDLAQKKKTGGQYRIFNRVTAPLVKMPSKHTHVVIHFSDKSTLYYNDIRQFGYLRLVRDEDLVKVREFKEYGPEPLERSFTFEVFNKALQQKRASITKQIAEDKNAPKPLKSRNPGRGKRAKGERGRAGVYKTIPIKLALMDPKVVVGIGNIYSDEILYHAGIRPDRPVNSLTQQELKKVFDNIKPVLRLGVKAKGSSVGDFIRTDGKWGSMGKHHYVYGRGGQPCKRCGTIIKSMKLGGRTSSYCPKEQD